MCPLWPMSQQEVYVRFTINLSVIWKNDIDVTLRIIGFRKENKHNISNIFLMLWSLFILWWYYLKQFPVWGYSQGRDTTKGVNFPMLNYERHAHYQLPAWCGKICGQLICRSAKKKSSYSSAVESKTGQKFCILFFKQC